MNAPHQLSRFARPWVCCVLVHLLPSGSWGSELVSAGEPGGLLPPLTESGQNELERLARDLTPVTEKLKIAVLDATVTVDGVLRPDLGASFSDTVAARLLREGFYDLVDSSVLGSSNTKAIDLNNSNLDLSGVNTPGPATALDFGKATGADYVVVPTLVCTATDTRMTVRKLRIPSGKIERIFQENIRGDYRIIFGLAERIALQLSPEKPVTPAEESGPKYNYVRVWMAPPLPEDPLKHQIQSAPKALRGSISPSATQAAARAWSGVSNDRREPSRLGEIKVVDPDWSFCELNCPLGTVSLKDQVFAWGGGPYDNLISMRVSRIDGRRVIAEFDAQHPLSKNLRSGLAIYTWKASTK